MMTLNPDKLKVSKKGDPDVLLAEFTEYVRKFGVFIAACGLDRDHVAGADDAHAGCATCRRLLATFKCVGQDEVMQLLGVHRQRGGRGQVGHCQDQGD